MIEKDLLFDKRILDRNLEKGLVTRAEYDKFIAGLSDLTKAVSLSKVEVSEGDFELGARVLSEEELLQQEDDLDG
ncbi:MAG: hypothetical protein ABIK09_16210 [Pseudomonadota bacterium]